MGAVKAFLDEDLVGPTSPRRADEGGELLAPIVAVEALARADGERLAVVAHEVEAEAS